MSIGAQLDAEGWATLDGFFAEESPDVGALYRELVPIANAWQAKLGAPLRFAADAGCVTVPEHFRLSAGEYQPLHQHDDTEFPLQLVGLLSEPNRDFAGGELVLVEQRPRMQSRPVVVPLRRGDVAVIAAGRRPHRGTRGSYAVNVRHAVSRVHRGIRIGLELRFR